MTRTGVRNWLVVLAIALVVHAALLLRFQLQDSPAPPQTGASRVRIALAPAPGPAKPEQVAADTSEKPDPSKDKQPPEPKPQPEPAPKPKPKPKPEPTPAPEPEPTPVPEPEPELEPEPEPEPKPRPEPEKQSEPEPVAAQPAQTAEPTGGKARTNAPAQAPQAAEHTQQGATGSVSDTPPDYRRTLGAWLQRYKQYPRRAQRLHQEGTVLLYFVMDRSGRVLDWEIRKSSGHERLDEAVRDMIRKADPLPALPSSVPMQRLALTVPISFKLR